MPRARYLLIPRDQSVQVFAIVRRCSEGYKRSTLAGP